MSKEKFNYVLNGQINNAIGSEFETSAMRLMIQKADFDTKISKHVLLDFASVDKNGLVVYEAKNYVENYSSAKSKAITSLSKITNDHKNFNLKIINPNVVSDSMSILHNEKMSDSNFANKTLGISNKRVAPFSRILNSYFLQSAYLNSLRKSYCADVDELKKDADLLNAGCSSNLDKYFLNIYNAYKKYSSATADLKIWAKTRMQKGNLTKDDWIRKSIEEHFCLISEKLGE